MVKTVRLGKKRSFVRGLLLVVVTFGFYAVYWWYKAPHEVFRQFDLEEEGRDEAVVWLVLGLVLPFAVVVYFWKAIGNIRYVRARLNLREGIKPGTFLALFFGPYVVIVVLLVVFLLALFAIAPGGMEGGDIPSDAEALVNGFLAVMVGLALLQPILAGVAFYRLQRDINEVWDAWAARIRQLTAPPLAPPPGYGEPVAPAAAPAPAGLPPWPGTVPRERQPWDDPGQPGASPG